MKFQNLIAVIAILSLAAQANAYSDGTLRGSTTVAQNDTAVVTETTPTQGVVIMNSNTNSNSSSAAAVAQPTTVVEASPVAESKAELMRKARQGEEVKTEQKIVEKLEESRLKEEQQRAERLFGNKLDAAPAAAAAASATAVATPDGAAATATATAVVAEPKDEAVKPTQVTIEKVEIIQPREEVVEKPVTAMKLEEPSSDDGEDKLFVGAILGAPNYNASNVKSNFGLGVAVGMNLATNWVLEGTFLYSNHAVDTYWQYPLYRDLDQYDFSVGAKYYILSGKLKPYAGANLTYIYRKYNDRYQNGNAWMYNQTTTEEESNAVNVGLTAGVDFAISKRIMIGGGLDYNFNVMNRQDFQSQYALPSDVKPLEEIDYTMIKVNAKMTF